MSKENIFQLVEKNYNTEKEIRKIHDMLTQDIFFKRTKSDADHPTAATTYHFFDFADKVLFQFVQNKGTCLGLAEFMARADAILEFGNYGNVCEYRIVNYLEIVEYMFNLYFYNKRHIEKRLGYEICYTPYNRVDFLMTELEKHLNLARVINKDLVTLEKVEQTNKKRKK